MTNKLMPALFLGHGSPMNAIEDNEFTKSFVRIAKEIPRPKAIICISAHWFTDGTKITGSERPKTIHDFYGFPKKLYEIEYPAPGNISLTRQIKEALSTISVDLDKNWGLDHGTWTILRHMYPDADIPVVQISVDSNLSGKEHLALGTKLAHFRERGILIIGSGNIVHNLRER